LCQGFPFLGLDEFVCVKWRNPISAETINSKVKQT
jgi:hypothetical protein